MKTRFIISVLVIALSLGACSSITGGDSSDGGPGFKQKVGTWMGAITGGLIGSKAGKGDGKTAMTIAGTILGAMAGSEIGRQMDQADLMYHRQALEEGYTAPLNRTIKWRNDSNGHMGSVTPVREGYQASTGNLCRQYKQAINIEGNTETAVGTACQNYDGTWSIAQ